MVRGEQKYLQSDFNQVHNSHRSCSVKLVTINNLPEAVYKQFLGNVILAVGVLEGKIELVVSLQHLETFGLF